MFAAYLTVLKQQLPSVKDVIVGNEPNLNRFWLPQFNPTGPTPPHLRTSRCSRGPTTR